MRNSSCCLYFKTFYFLKNCADQIKCIGGPDKKCWRAGSGPRAVVCPPLSYPNIIVALIMAVSVKHKSHSAYYRDFPSTLHDIFPLLCKCSLFSEFQFVKYINF